MCADSSFVKCYLTLFIIIFVVARLMLHRLGQLEEAISVFDHVLSEVTDDRLVYESRGLVFQDQGRHRRAVSDFTKAIQLDDDVGENYYHRGESMLRLRRLDEALEEFHTATRRGYGVTHIKYIYFFCFCFECFSNKIFFRFITLSADVY